MENPPPKEDQPENSAGHNHENKVRVPRPNSIIMCIYGVMTNQEIHQNNLNQFLQKNLQRYMMENWHEKKMELVKERLIKENKIDRSSGSRDLPKLPKTGTEEEQIKAYVENILSRMKKPLSKASIIHKIKDWIWAQGYCQGTLKAHIYPDVANHLENWRMKLMIKLYTYALGDPSGQRLFLQSTPYGDMTPFFNNYLMTTDERRKSSNEYAIICRLIRDEPKNLLFLTSDLEEARAAHASNLHCLLVNRKNKSLDDVDVHPFKMAVSFDDIEFIDDGQRPCC